MSKRELFSLQVRQAVYAATLMAVLGRVPLSFLKNKK